MRTYEITNNNSGQTLGQYSGETEQEALDAMARDAGYTDHRQACEATGTDGSELSVEVVEG